MKNTLSKWQYKRENICPNVASVIRVKLKSKFKEIQDIRKKKYSEVNHKLTIRLSGKWVKRWQV